MQILGIAFILLSVAWVAIVVLEAYGIRMRFRFTIRDLLWLTTVMARAVGWWVSNRSLRRQLDLVKNNRQPVFDTSGHAIPNMLQR